MLETKMDARFTAIDERFGAMTGRMNSMEHRLETVGKTVDAGHPGSRPSC